MCGKLGPWRKNLTIFAKRGVSCSIIPAGVRLKCISTVPGPRAGIRRSSDIDVGILSRRRLPIETWWEIKEALDNSLIVYEVDLVDLFDRKTNRGGSGACRR